MQRGNVNPDDRQYKQTLDIKYILNVQIMTCNRFSGSPLFDPAVYTLLNNLPVDTFAAVHQQSDQWKDSEYQLIFKTFSGIRMGHKNDPLVWNKNKTDFGLSSDPAYPVDRLEGKIDQNDPNFKEFVNTGTEDDPIMTPTFYDETIPPKLLEGEIDWDDPNIYSPYRKGPVDMINYDDLYRIILTEIEVAGLSWDIDKNTRVTSITNPKRPKRPSK